MWHHRWHVTWYVTFDTKCYMWQPHGMLLDMWHVTWQVNWHVIQDVRYDVTCDMTCDMTCDKWCNIWNSVSTGGHWGKIVFLEFELFTCRYLNFRLCWSLNCFYFFQLQNNELSRDLQSWTNLPVLTFSLKYGQNLSSKYKIKTCSWEAIFMNLFLYLNIYLNCYEKSFVKITSQEHIVILYLDEFFCHFKYKCQNLQIWPTLEGSCGLIFWRLKKIKTVPWPT